jgi:hypothetical protein
VVEDGVEPKPGKNKVSGVGVGSDECKPTNDVKFKVKIPFQVALQKNVLILAVFYWRSLWTAAISCVLRQFLWTPLYTVQYGGFNCQY